MSEINEIKAQLEKRLQELTERAHEIDEGLSEPPDHDWAENAIESENDEVLETMGGMAVNEIHQIRAALAKIEAGTYGICEFCDKEIPVKRLQALPYATRCIDCA